MRAVLMSPDLFSSELSVGARKGDMRVRQNGQDLIKSLWKRTEGFCNASTKELLRIGKDSPKPDRTLNLMLDDAALAAIDSIDGTLGKKLLAGVDLPEVLPLADRLLSQLDHKPQLGNTVLLGCQHLMGSTITQLRYLREFGIPWSNMYIMGKPYSTNRAVAAILRREGAYVHRVSDQFPGPSSTSLRSYDSKMEDAANDLIGMVREKHGKASGHQRVLVLDDGGLLTSVLAAKRGLEPSQLVGVEQTTGGIRKLAATDLPFPVVDVADSGSKVAFEAPFIAESIVAETSERLRRIRGSARWGQERVLLIGYGTVGSWVASHLAKRGVGQLVIFDRDNRKASSAMAAKCEVAFDLRNALYAATVIIGCTGGRAFPQTLDGEIGPDAILVSGSSGNVEFNGLMHRPAAARYMKQPNSVGQAISDTQFAIVHDDYRGTNERGQFWITNGGFPINFTGAQDPIQVNDIQITRTLMLAGAVQATGLFGHGGGLQPFEHSHDQCIINAVAELRSGRKGNPKAKARRGHRPRDSGH